MILLIYVHQNIPFHNTAEVNLFGVVINIHTSYYGIALSLSV
jgi:hypothetical protein